MGKPTIDTWTDSDHLMLLTSWCRAGFCYKQIAENIGINRTTLVTWRKKNKLLRDTLNTSKEIANAHVENALYKSALGFNYDEQVVTNKGEVVWITKFERPSIAAQIFYLKNRNSKLWNDRREINHKADIKSHDVIVKWGGEIIEGTGNEN